MVVPAALRELTGDRGELTVEAGDAATVGEVFARLKAAYPALYDRIVDERGEVREHVNVFVGGEEIRWTGGLATPVAAGAEVQVIRSVSGG